MTSVLGWKTEMIRLLASQHPDELTPGAAARVRDSLAGSTNQQR